jgi:cobalt/nickel transport system permease protein
VAERRRPSLLAFVVVGLAAAAALVVLVAPRASSSPDGLEKVAAEKGIDSGVREHALGDSPFADYATEGVDHDAIGTIVAGLIGVAITFVACAGLVVGVRRRRAPPTSPAPMAAAPPG